MKRIILVFMLLFGTQAHAQKEHIYTKYPFKFIFHIEDDSLKKISIENISKDAVYLDTTISFGQILDTNISQITVGKLHPQVLNNDSKHLLVKVKNRHSLILKELQILDTSLKILVYYILEPDIEEIQECIREKKCTKTKNGYIIPNYLYEHLSSSLILTSVYKFNFDLSKLNSKNR